MSCLVAGLLCVTAPAAAFAQQGDWLVRAGWSQVDPKDDNLKLAPDTVLQAHKDERFTSNVTYMIRDNWGIELLASDQWNHGFRTYVNNLAPSVLSSEVEHIPPTLSLNYHFNPIYRFRPHRGAGLNYTMFSGERPSGLSLDNSWGLAAQAGVDMDLTDKWFLNYAVRWIDIDADAKSTARRSAPSRSIPGCSACTWVTASAGLRPRRYWPQQPHRRHRRHPRRRPNTPPGPW